tara:strand:- start:1118 stop:1552 length:435 start_codon:yes stop_codon:yes gene_type:complete
MKKIFIILITLFFNSFLFAEQTIEQIIKERQSIFSKNYKTAKRVSSLASNGDLENAKKLIIQMSENYRKLINLFPENTQEGFETEALPAIWENKGEFKLLMTKASTDLIKLTSVIDNSDNMKTILSKHMWGSCKACHTKFRADH